MPGAFFIVAAVVIRLSYFNIYGLIDSKTYMGLAVDNNALILAFFFLFESFLSHTFFSILLYALIMILSALNLSSTRTHKFGAKWIYGLIAYVIVMTIVFGSILLNKV